MSVNKPVDDVSEDVIDQGLEHCGSVSQTKRYHQIFEVSQGNVENSLPLVPFADADKVIYVAQVKFGEDCGSKEGHKQNWLEVVGTFVNSDI